MLPTSAEPIRVYLLDDHDLVRRGLRDLLAPARDVVVVGESGSASDAADQILAVGTDVMLLDLHLRDGNGVEVCRQVRGVRPSTRGLLLTAADDDEAAIAAVLAGAAGYTTKYARGADLVGAIRLVASGRALMDAEVAAGVAESFRRQARALHPSLDPDDSRLLGLVLEGRTNGEIADLVESSADEVEAAVITVIERATQGRPASWSLSRTEGRHRRDRT